MSDSEPDQADPSDQVKPWTVKGIGPEARNAAIAAAKRENQTLGEWITRAIRAQVQSDRQANRAPVPVDQPPPKSDLRADLSAIERMIALAATIATTNGQPIPATIARAAHGLMRDHLRAIKAGRTG